MAGSKEDGNEGDDGTAIKKQLELSLLEVVGTIGCFADKECK